VTEKGQALHKSLFITDLHADSLLWFSRDLLKRNSHGHVDIPRLQEGNVAIQAFTIVTSTPSNMNFDNNAEPGLLGDSITLKGLAERWGWAAISRFLFLLFFLSFFESVCSSLLRSLFSPLLFLLLQSCTACHLANSSLT
jgi:hypothetical protein